MTQIITAKNSHILLVDDMKLNRDLVVILLEGEGYRVTATDNALDALQSMAKVPFAGILIDIRMPGMDGLTAVKIIRSCENGQVPTEHFSTDLADQLVSQLGNQKTPIIMMTASNTEEEKERGLAAGADEFLRKPFTPEKLLSAMAKVLKAEPQADCIPLKHIHQPRTEGIERFDKQINGTAFVKKVI